MRITDDGQTSKSSTRRIFEEAVGQPRQSVEDADKAPWGKGTRFPRGRSFLRGAVGQ
jgi:hypothetical protein